MRLRLDFCHYAGTKIVRLSAAVRAVIEVGVIAAASVFDEGAKGECARLHGVLARPANTKVPALHIDIGAGLVAERTATHTCPEAIGSTAVLCRSTRFLPCRIHSRTCEEVCAVVQERTCPRTRLDDGLGLLAHARLRDRCNELMRVMRILRDVKRIPARNTVYPLCRHTAADGDVMSATGRVLHQRERIALRELLRRTAACNDKLHPHEVLVTARDSSQLQQRIRIVHRSGLHVKVEILDTVKILDRRGRTRAVGNGKRIVLPICRRTARDRARDRRIAETDHVVVRHRPLSACDIAGKRMSRDIDHVVRCLTARGVATDNTPLCILRHIDRIRHSLAAGDIRPTAVDGSIDTTRDIDRVRVAVARISPRRRRSRAAGIAAVDRLSSSISHSDRVARRRISRSRAPAPHLSTERRRRRCALNGVAVADNLRIACSRLDVCFLRAVRTQFRTKSLSVLERQTTCILDEKRRIRRRVKVCLNGIKIEIRHAARQCQL